MADSDHRRLLTDLQIRSEAEYDRSLLTLSAGALGLSVGFAHDLVGPTPVHRWLVLCAWLSWALTLGLVTLSHFLSAKAMRTAIDTIDGQRPAADRDGGRAGRAVRWINPVAGFGLVLGMILFAAFVYSNWS